MPKLLSIATSARNDNYMGNFIYRLTTSINYLAYNLNKIGRLDDVEIIITDWGSDVPLSKVLELSIEAVQICKFVYVPPSLAKSIKEDGVDIATSTNVALRRGEGDFLMIFPSDTLVPLYSLETLLKLLDGTLAMPFDIHKMYYFIGRYQIPFEVVRREPDLEQWDHYLLFNTADLLHDEGLSGLGMWGAALMIPRQILYECRGLDEGMKKWGWHDADITLRISQYYPWIDILNLGISFYHMEHHQRRTPLAKENQNDEIVNPCLAVNDDHWGLSEYEFDIQMAENIRKTSPGRRTNNADKSDLDFKRSTEDISLGLTDKYVRDHVQKTFKKIGVERLNNLSSDEWEYIDALAWYSLKYYPLNYLEFGIQIPYAASIVASASPGVQIYGVDAWQEMPGLQRVVPPNIVAFQLKKMGYRGYTRYIGGDIHTALRRLNESCVGPLSIDLALVRGDLFGNDALRQMNDLLPLINDGGALVYHSSAQLFNFVWDEIRNKYPQLTYLDNRVGQYSSGLIFKRQLT